MNNGLPGARLRRITEFIEDNLPRALPLAELSTVAHLSPCHLTRLFKRATGLSPHQFILRRRIDRARVLLAARELSIAAVGHAVGFRSCSHFSATFRRVTGTSPSVYQTDARMLAEHGELRADAMTSISTMCPWTTSRSGSTPTARPARRCPAT
jgi:AraC family transcriptional regulator